MNYSCHSEYHKIKSVFLTPVSLAFENESKLKREWSELNYLSQPNFNKARKEYGAFETLLRSEGANLEYFPFDASLSLDAIYCRDASISTDHGMIICNMGKEARIQEPKAQKTIYQEKNISILGEIKAPGTVEGGDVAWLDKNTLAVGQSYRTNKEGIQQLQHLLSPLHIEVLVVDLPHYKGPADVFHLMSVLSPVDKNLAVVYSPLMPIRFRNELQARGFELVEVPDEEFESMGCNVLAIAPRICVMVQGNPITEMALKKVGCKVLTYKGQEISVKGGGGPTCLTRPILRHY